MISDSAPSGQKIHKWFLTQLEMARTAGYKWWLSKVEQPYWLSSVLGLISFCWLIDHMITTSAHHLSSWPNCKRGTARSAISYHTRMRTVHIQAWLCLGKRLSLTLISWLYALYHPVTSINVLRQPSWLFNCNALRLLHYCVLFGQIQYYPIT